MFCVKGTADQSNFPQTKPGRLKALLCFGRESLLKCDKEILEEVEPQGKSDDACKSMKN